MRTFARLLSEDDLELLHRAAVRILSEAGMRFESDRLLQHLKRGGARIDPARHRAYFPEEMIERYLELIRHGNKGRISDPLVSRKMGCEFCLDFGYECFFLYDWPARDRRSANEQDVITLMHLGDVLPEVTSVGLPVLNSATDQRVEALETIALLLRHTSKHRGAGIRTTQQVPYMIEIDTVLGYGPDNPHFTQLGRCMISPLSFGSDAAGIFEALIDAGWDNRFWVATMPLAGGTGPVTSAGSAALMIAEILGGWILTKCVNPEAQIGATVISGSLDMRQACACFASPEAILQDMAGVEYFRQTLGIEVGYDPGYTDAKVPGLQCAWEKCFKQIAFGLTLGPALTIGSLEGGATFSPTQAMLEIDLNRAQWRFFRGLPINDTTLAVDEIISVCQADQTSFLGIDHTMQHYRDAIWQSEYFSRGPWTTGEAEWTRAERVLDEADEKWRAMLKQYRSPEVDADKLREVDRIIDRARRDLC